MTLSSETAPTRGSMHTALSQRVVLGLMAAGTVYLLANLLVMPFGRDQAVFAVGARTMADGGALYRDVWDVKPPGIFYLYRLGHALFGVSEAGIRLFEIVWMAGLCVVFGLFTRLVLPLRAAIPACLIAAFHLLIGGYWNTAQTETFAALFVCGGTLLALLRPAQAPIRHLTWAGCSACFAAAVLLKPTLGVGVIPCAVYISVIEVRRAGPGALLAPFLAFLTGAGLVAAASLLQLWSSGALPDFLQTMFEFAPRYTALAHEARGLPELTRRTLVGFFAHYAFLLPGLILLAWFGRKDRNLAMPSGMLVLQVLVLLLGVGLQGKFYNYHFAAAALVASLPAGWGLWLLLDRLSTRAWGPAVFALAIGLVMIVDDQGRRLWKDNLLRIAAAVTPEKRFEIETRMYRVHTSDTAANRMAGEWLERNAPDRNAKLLVLGFEPVIYLYSGLDHFTRFIFSVPLKTAWGGARAREELMEALEAPPWAIVVQSSDRLPQMSGDRRDTRAFILEEMPDLQSLLETDYELTESFGPLEVYTRPATE